MKVEFQRCCRLEKCTAYPSVPHPSNHELNASWEVHMTERILTLERRLRRTQFILASALVAFVALAARHSLSLAASADDKILHLRGLVIEDAEGHPRLLLGVPTPEVAGRKRKE